MRLSCLPRPFLVNVVTDRTTNAAITTMRLAELDGAHAHELNLPLLPDSIEVIADAVRMPVYTSCRRAPFFQVYGIDPETVPAWSDEERMNRQLDAVRAGAVAIDLEMDTFDPQPAPQGGSAGANALARPGVPAEFSEQPAALALQAEVIAAAHDLGAEVILSCHTGRVLGSEQIAFIAGVARSRGADLVKIVTPCHNRRDLYAVLEAIATLAAQLPIPFIVVGSGVAGLPSRSIGVQFGATYALGQQTLTVGGFHDQPLITQLRELARLLPWGMAGVPA